MRVERGAPASLGISAINIWPGRMKESLTHLHVAAPDTKHPPTHQRRLLCFVNSARPLCAHVAAWSEWPTPTVGSRQRTWEACIVEVEALPLLVSLMSVRLSALLTFICLFWCATVAPSVCGHSCRCHSTVHLSLTSSLSPSTSSSLCLSVHFSVCLSERASARLSARPLFPPSALLSERPSVRPSALKSDGPSVRPSVRPCLSGRPLGRSAARPLGRSWPAGRLGA